MAAAIFAIALALSALALAQNTRPPFSSGGQVSGGNGGDARNASSDLPSTALPVILQPSSREPLVIQAATTEAVTTAEEEKGAVEMEGVKERVAAPGDVSSQPAPADSRSDDPPSEFFPPPRMEYPLLEAAAGRKLQFGIRFPYEIQHPTIVFWFYKKENDSKWIETGHTTIECQNGFCLSSYSFRDLEQSTTYYVRAMPKVQNSVSTKNWYNKTIRGPFTDTAKGSTCAEELPRVKDLRVHTSGPRWLAISWLPPAMNCFTHLEYLVRLFVSEFEGLGVYEISSPGSFWSNATWSVNGLVSPCFAWPERHCLLITKFIRPQKEYTVEVKIRRTLDKKESEPASARGTTNSTAPGPPEDLRCVQALPTSLELRWRCPLSPGGILTNFHVRVHSVNDTFEIYEPVSLRPQFSKMVEGLQPRAWHKLIVWFDTKDGTSGKAEEIEVWTPPFENTTEPDKPCGQQSNLMVSSMHSNLMVVAANGSVGGNFGHSAGHNSEGPGEDDSGSLPWVWITVCVFLMVMVVTALYVGRRWGSRRPWILALHDDRSNKLLDDNCTPGMKAKGTGEQAALCTSAGSESSGTPPSCVFEYAEVELASGRPYTTAPRRGPLPDYEEIRDRKPFSEQPYATSQAPLTPIPFYAESGRSIGPPPLPTTQPPVYAQVDKKRPPPAPPAPRRPLQDSV